MAESSEKSIFLSALEFEATEDRHEFVERACGGNPRLREAVDDLLAAHDQTNNVLDLIPEPVGVLRAHLESTPDQDTAGTIYTPGATPPSIAEGPGTIIGRYKLLEQIGEGGFGYVFVAEQQQPVRRKVALKVIKPGMDSHEVIARFEAERQALALMDHPNIAHVFDAGTTATGRPYFVMELVRGVAITEFCEECGVTVWQRLELFIHVCHAVQHAHQKGIIHRDLKPPNVMVTLHDGTPVVKVIDFGVAKAMCEPLTEKTIHTRFAQVIGTPLYMSPEQVELSGLDVDTRSDIYSLGVLLYELLTGTTPFDRQRLHAVSFDELRRIIREEEPPRPSARLTTLGHPGPTVATDRRLMSRMPPLAVRGDLDWIVMKALEKDRTRRYATAVEFAADVRRYLDQEPVAARPPSPLYRFSKFARRNKVLLTTVSLVLSALVLGTAVSTWLAIQATTARAEADSMRQKAVDFAENLKQANILLDNARANADGERWATAYGQYTKAAELQPDHYPVWSGRAALFVRLGLWKQAAADYAKALDLGVSPNNPGWWGVPQLCLYAGSTKTYHAVSDQMLAQSEASSDSMLKIFALRGCLAEANPDADPEKLVRLAESLLIESPRGFFGPQPFGMSPPGRHRDGPPDRALGPPPEREPGRPPGREPGPPSGREFGGPQGPGAPRELQFYVAGLAHYRAGHLEKAIEYLQKTVQSGPRWPAQAVAYPALAMAYYRAGKSDEARSQLAKAKQALDEWIDAMQAGSVGSMPVPWFDFIEYLVLYREASALITSSPLPEDPRLAALEQRALDAIEPQ